MRTSCARIDELEDEAENVAIGFLLMRRLEQSSGATTSGADFIRELGFDDLAVFRQAAARAGAEEREHRRGRRG